MAAALTIVLMSATGLFASGRWHAATTAGSVNEEKYSPRAVNPEEEGTDFTILNNAELRTMIWSHKSVLPPAA